MTSAEAILEPVRRPVQPVSGSRMAWMDIVRGAAVLAVVAFHSVTMVERYGIEANVIWRYLNETLKLFRMPILVFLSGMLLTRSLAKPTPQYIYGKISGIFWPFLVWSTIYGVVLQLDFTNIQALQILYTGGSHLWFLVFLLSYYIVAKPLEGVHPLVIAAVAFALSIASPDGDKYSERILFLMSLFFLASFASR